MIMLPMLVWLLCFITHLVLLQFRLPSPLPLLLLLLLLRLVLLLLL